MANFQMGSPAIPVLSETGGTVSLESVDVSSSVTFPAGHVIQVVQTVKTDYFNSQSTSFQDIKDGLCRWPLGEPEEIDFKFCGRNTNEGFVYCQAHHKQAYQPLSKVRERKKIKKKFRIS